MRVKPGAGGTGSAPTCPGEEGSGALETRHGPAASCARLQGWSSSHGAAGFPLIFLEIGNKKKKKIGKSCSCRCP